MIIPKGTNLLSIFMMLSPIAYRIRQPEIQSTWPSDIDLFIHINGE